MKTLPNPNRRQRMFAYKVKISKARDEPDKLNRQTELAIKRLTKTHPYLIGAEEIEIRLYDDYTPPYELMLIIKFWYNKI